MSLFYYPNYILKRKLGTIELFNKIKPLLQFEKNSNIKETTYIVARSKVKTILVPKDFLKKINRYDNLLKKLNLNKQKNQFKNTLFFCLFKKKNYAFDYFFKDNPYILHYYAFDNIYNEFLLFKKKSFRQTVQKNKNVENLFINKYSFKYFFENLSYQELKITNSLILLNDSFKFIVNDTFLIILNLIKINFLKYFKIFFSNFCILNFEENKRTERISFKFILNFYIKQLILNCLLKLINIYFCSSINNWIIIIKTYLFKKINKNYSNEPLSILIRLNNFYTRFFYFYFKLLKYYFLTKDPFFLFQKNKTIIKNFIYNNLFKKKKINYKIDNLEIKVKNYKISYYTGLKDYKHVSLITLKLMKINTLNYKNFKDFFNLTFLSKNKEQKRYISRKLLLILKKKHNNKSNYWVSKKYQFRTINKLAFLEIMPLNIAYQKLQFLKKKEKTYLKLKKKINNYIFKNLLVKKYISTNYLCST